ncbi:hypothetical protein, partial [Pseudomonas aeruginosa]|uniref:hypothetical protein n=1 Tax=Pseudomonas aeruginosa TaxID=287 RepID=UPI003CF861DF
LDAGWTTTYSPSSDQVSPQHHGKYQEILFRLTHDLYIPERAFHRLQDLSVETSVVGLLPSQTENNKDQTVKQTAHRTH